jgi:arsenate reductase (thioredoxin)
VKKEKRPDPHFRHSSKRTRVLFVCVGNACRSPMAEAIARYDAADVIEPSSAGLYPLGHIADMTMQTLLRNGYPANNLTSSLLTPEEADVADLIVNMTGRPLGEFLEAEEKTEHWIVEDPYGTEAETYQRVFEGIRRRVNQLAQGLREKRQSRKTAR